MRLFDKLGKGEKRAVMVYPYCGSHYMSARRLKKAIAKLNGAPYRERPPFVNECLLNGSVMDLHAKSYHCS